MSRKSGGAFFVALGIFLSRIAGLIRERVFAHYFGNSAAGDAFKAALRIPNFLQNLFGEGVLSASFIPVYANLLAKKANEDADRVAGAIASLLAVIVSALVIVGVLFTPAFIDLIAPGFDGDRRLLTIDLVQILFPGIGILVMSAWCLGILNSHRRFFLSYFAPVLWNAAIIAALLLFGEKQQQGQLAITTAWGLVVGSALQFVVQLPLVLRLIGKLRLSFSLEFSPVRQVLKTFVPVLFSRGVVQISAYIDSVYASWLPTGAVAAIAYAQTIYLLPVSLFGMSVSAAELPAMSGVVGSREEISKALENRIARSLTQVVFFVVPTLLVFLVLGDLVVGVLFQSGEFDRNATILVWSILAGSALGLLPATQGRLYSSAFYALRDPSTPLKFAMLRVGLTTFLGYFAALRLPGWLGIEAIWGAVALTVSSGLMAWPEFFLLRRSLGVKFGARPRLMLAVYLRIWFAALVAVGVGFCLRALLRLQAGNESNPIAVLFELPSTVGLLAEAFCVFGFAGLAYFAVATVLGIPQAKQISSRILRRSNRN